MARGPVLAAGGIVVRGGSKPLIAIVQRRKDDGWVLPKGKLKPNEKAIAAAKREVIEETGHNVFVHEFVGAISYEVGRKPKVVQFWRMQADGGPAYELMRDIKAVEWLPLKSAIEKLSLPLEREFLRNIGRHALKQTQSVDLVEPAAEPSLFIEPKAAPSVAMERTMTLATGAEPATEATCLAVDATWLAECVADPDALREPTAAPGDFRFPAAGPEDALVPEARPNLFQRMWQLFR